MCTSIECDNNNQITLIISIAGEFAHKFSVYQRWLEESEQVQAGRRKQSAIGINMLATSPINPC
jgi:hypothetical protein